MQTVPSDDDVTNEDLIFGAFYRGEMSASQLVNLMGRLASCPGQTAEAELLARMLRTLFTECRHLPRYPIPELYKTADFYGKLIRSELLLKRPELQLLAIRCVMEALRKEVHTPIFRFGLVALQGFLPLAPSSPAFLTTLTRMPGLKEYFPGVVRYAEQCLSLLPPKMRNASLLTPEVLKSALNGNQFPSAEGVLVIPPSFQLVPTRQSLMSDNAPIFRNPNPSQMQMSATFGNVAVPEMDKGIGPPVKLQGFGLGQVERLMEDPEIMNGLITPPETFRTKVFRIFNSLVRSNLDQKVDELLQSLQPDWLPWVGFYLVKSRASKETNHHELYCEFANKLGGARMLDMLANLTYDCINVLLKYIVSAREATSYRSVLKSLGSWLGLLTLAQNKPLKAKCFDVKHLLYDAYERGNLSATLPLVCGCLNQARNSKIFKPPNPWLMSCLTTIANLFTSPGLKQNVLFEIELLMRNLNLDIATFVDQTPNVFASLKPAIDSPDFISVIPPPDSKSTVGPPANANATVGMMSNGMNSNVAPPSHLGPAVSSLAQSLQHLVGNKVGPACPPIVAAPWPTNDKNNLGTLRTQLLNNLAGSVVVSRSLAIFQKHPELRIAVPIAVERAVREILNVVSERAVILAVGTTTELVLKDFCMESQETLVKRAAHLMAACLGGSIVLVTARAALKNTIAGNLKELICSVDPMLVSNKGSDEVVEHTANVAANENVDIATVIVEQAVIEHAVRATQEALAANMASRRAAAERGEPYRDPNFFGPECVWPGALPPLLALTSTLESHQLQVYKDFAQSGPLLRMRENAEAASRQAEQMQQHNTETTDGSHSMAPGVSSGPAPKTNTVEAKQMDSSTSAPDVDADAPPQMKKTLLAISDAVTCMKDAIKALMVQQTHEELPLPEEEFASSPAIALLSTLPRNHEIFLQLSEIVDHVQNCEHTERVALSTARRLLRSIYDAARRGAYQSTEITERPDISAVYLEVFIALLRMFDHLQLVHNLKEVVTIWLISATYLVPSQKAAKAPPQSVDFTNFPEPCVAHGLIVLYAAAKYDLVEPSIIDRVFVGALVTQAVAALEQYLDRSTSVGSGGGPTGSEDGGANLTPDVLIPAAAQTIEFAITTVHALRIVPKCVSNPRVQLKQTMEGLSRIDALLSANATHPVLRRLEKTELKLRFPLQKELEGQPQTIKSALRLVFNGFSSKTYCNTTLLDLMDFGEAPRPPQ